LLVKRDISSGREALDSAQPTRRPQMDEERTTLTDDEIISARGEIGSEEMGGEVGDADMDDADGTDATDSDGTDSDADDTDGTDSDADDTDT
jgi:hypothetical protein